MTLPTHLLDTLEKAAIDAGKAILAVYDAGPTVAYKDDQSPVTEADERAEAIILAQLAAAFPDIPVVAEESVAAGRVPNIAGGRFFLVDPLDGTREFIDRRDEFTVNIALIDDGTPVAGVVYAPALRIAFSGAVGHAEKIEFGPDFSILGRRAIGCRTRGDKLTAVVSRSHSDPQTDVFLERNGISDHRSVGSSLKFCLLAEGLADVYPRFGRTMEWDTAAGDAILRAAGGRLSQPDGSPFIYGKTSQTEDAEFANPAFIGWGRSRDCDPASSELPGEAAHVTK
ncbi:3'(2'),5'-bisphosphate nucleotidase CysQ [Rhizobium sp. ARZ01]|uniref:3'(2'),5'-bisphosphate nucleotidase CysQ n=1 Tax=Rhizobium sp. ARZ01 TaxID=2769313 RepID=UPI0017834D45|nr:3'(2'),5'-bisphosphate nucleotidase CysQ [Rhizobium sp. ARZ01]MBD9373363.1 3'(2'),5'-bisphosphate nucleotidase CysQ [Rhizobium sp. ARZ01]